MFSVEEMEGNGGVEVVHKGTEDEAGSEESRGMIRSFSAAEDGSKAEILPRNSSALALEITCSRDSPQKIASSRRGVFLYFFYIESIGCDYFLILLLLCLL